jgi:hypothetical protein
MAKLVRGLRDEARLPPTFTLDACRHGGMTELEETELTDGQGRALSAHKSRAYEGYAKRTMEQALAATRKRHRSGLRAYRTLREQNFGMKRLQNFGMTKLDRAARQNKTYITLIGWGARIRTWEWRNENPSRSGEVSVRIPKNRGNTTPVGSTGSHEFRNAVRPGWAV